MVDLAHAITRNLPEVLARDLVKSERVFRTRTLTSGAPALSLASESPPPDVPQRNPGRAATNTLHRAASDTALCPHQDRTRGITDTARGGQRGGADKDANSRYCSVQDERQGKKMDGQYTHMNQENDKGRSRLFLNSLDEDWGSDSSADIGAGRSSPSMRIRKQSVTTTATSVEARSVVGAGMERIVCASPTQSLDDQGAKMSHKGGESWVDLGPDVLSSEEDVSGLDVSIKASKSTDWPNTQPPTLSNEDDDQPEQLTFVNIPRRRSSLSHQVTTVILSETAHTTRQSPTPPALSQELASQLLLPSPHNPACHFSSSPYHRHPKDWTDSEAAGSPVVPTCPPQAIRKPEHALKATVQDQLRPASPPAKETARNALDTTHQAQQRPNLLNKLRKTQSHSKMHILTQVQSWLDSSGTPRPGFAALANPSSPTGRTSLASIRVPAEVLENLRISVGNFPDTMLRTSSLTIQTIRSYSRKLKRGGGFNNERAFARDSDEIAFDALDSPASVYAPALDRQPSFGSLKIKKMSLRGRLNLTSRLASSPTSPSLKEEDDFWRDFDDRWPATRSDTPPSCKSHSEVSACVAALRSIFPNGTDYLLDALYAHIIAYNYINSLCGGLPHLQGDGGQRLLLRARPSTNFAVPPGVTSRVDLELQDPDDSVVREYEDDVASVASTAVVPKKAASLLGLGATNMGKPRPGGTTLGGRRAKHRRATQPPAASFSASLESEPAMRDLRGAIAVNINQLVATVRSASAIREGGGDADDDGALLGGAAKELEPTLLRALCEVVRCYEELS